MKRISALLTIFFILNLLAIPAYAQPDNANNGTNSQEIEIIVDPLESTEIENSLEAADELEEQLELIAESAILIEQSTGKVLFEKNADKRLYPASTTKILTALLAIEYGNMKDTVTVGNEANLCQPDGSKAGLDLHEQITLENLLYGLILSSGNDAAFTIGVYIGRKVTNDPSLPIEEALNKFAELMNEKAVKLGAKNSHFVNPHGYHHDDHYTTARDLAIITQEAMKHDFFRQVVNTTMFTIEDWNGVDPKDPNKKEIRYWRNSNALIQPNDKFYYEYATGVKTGYTSKAGHCLVTSATKDDLNLITVVLNSSKDGKWTDSTTLMEYGFDNYKILEPIKEGQRIQTVGVHNHSSNDPGWLDIITGAGFSDVFNKKDVNHIEQEIIWDSSLLYTDSDSEDENTIYLEAPISQSQRVGTLILKLKGREIRQIPLIAARSVDRKETIIEKLLPPESNSINKKSSPSWLWLVVTFIVLIFILRISALRRRRRRRKYIYTRRRY